MVMTTQRDTKTTEHTEGGEDQSGPDSDTTGVAQSDRREDRREGEFVDRRDHGGGSVKKMPTVLKGIALLAIAAGGAYMLIEGIREEPVLERNMVGQADGYRLETGRPTPPAAETLSETFVPVDGAAREQVLQRLSEFRATWKVADPRIALTSTDVSGDANAFAEQLQGWLQQYNLLAESAVKDAPNMAGIPGATLPAPPMSGLVIRCREEDDAIARDLALALAPVVDGEVNIVFDERISANRVQVAIVGAPRFGKDGIAYFGVA